MGARRMRIAPWNIAMVLPPSALPSTTAARLTGATRISRRKPNSRSQTMEMAAKIDVKRTAIEMIPG